MAERRHDSAGGRSSAPARATSESPVRRAHHAGDTPAVALLTGGGDKPYALGLAAALSALGIAVDFIGSDDLDVPELRRVPSLKFLNLRGDQRTGVGFLKKVARVLTYYGRLMRYAATARPKVFHILWNNRFEFFDRTFLMLYYKLLGKRIAFTAHNVNAGRRDQSDGFLNRLSLSLQYRLADHLFVHTPKMKDELVAEFGVSPAKVSVISLGINNTVPVTSLTCEEAKRRLNLRSDEKTLLFFGRIAPYKGVDCLVDALAELSRTHTDYRLLVVGSLQNCAEYWRGVHDQISRLGLRERVIERIEFVPDDQTELFFKAADVMVLPYTEVYQSGVLILSYSFGLPVIAADVGSFREDIVEGKTGWIFRPKDAKDLALVIEKHFSSPLCREPASRRQEIQLYANERFSWKAVGETTRNVYVTLQNAR